MTALARCALICIALAGAASAQAAPGLILMEPEITGDLGDPAQQPEWPRRLEELRADVAAGLEAKGLYAPLDPATAEAEFALHRKRNGVFSCMPCIASVAEASGAERVLSLQVYRTSQLILWLYAALRDSEDMRVVYARQLSFRGDNDRSWRRAAEYLVEDMAARIPQGAR